MTYKAIIFDLDGTLVNSIEDLADAMNSVLKNKNYPTHNYEAYKHFVGSGIRSLVIKALPETQRVEAQIKNCFDQMISIYSKQCTNKTKPYDGIIDLLNQLKARNLKLSVLSNKADELTKKITLALFPDYFSPVLGLKQEALKKPNPVVALQICNQLNVKPEETIYVGDTAIDMQTANNSNMLAVGVPWGFRDKKELIESNAKHILNHPLDLIKLL
ncbi:HAD family hydrolase [Algibacter aquimarinus]|uniref:phosphoglycolate phosphatase n=1 Tax=Algibacter aquimarinus TaxID=1136748 RepID=A0ABP9HQA8_9FLAO